MTEVGGGERRTKQKSSEKDVCAREQLRGKLFPAEVTMVNAVTAATPFGLALFAIFEAFAEM